MTAIYDTDDTDDPDSAAPCILSIDQDKANPKKWWVTTTHAQEARARTILKRAPLAVRKQFGEASDRWFTIAIRRLVDDEFKFDKTRNAFTSKSDRHLQKTMKSKAFKEDFQVVDATPSEFRCPIQSISFRLPGVFRTRSAAGAAHGTTSNTSSIPRDTDDISTVNTRVELDIDDLRELEDFDDDIDGQNRNAEEQEGVMDDKDQTSDKTQGPHPPGRQGTTTTMEIWTMEQQLIDWTELALHFKPDPASVNWLRNYRDKKVEGWIAKKDPMPAHVHTEKMVNVLLNGQKAWGGGSKGLQFYTMAWSMTFNQMMYHTTMHEISKDLDTMPTSNLIRIPHFPEQHMHDSALNAAMDHAGAWYFTDDRVCSPEAVPAMCVLAAFMTSETYFTSENVLQLVAALTFTEFQEWQQEVRRDWIALVKEKAKSYEAGVFE